MYNNCRGTYMKYKELIPLIKDTFVIVWGNGGFSNYGHASETIFRYARNCDVLEIKVNPRNAYLEIQVDYTPVIEERKRKARERALKIHQDIEKAIKKNEEKFKLDNETQNK